MAALLGMLLTGVVVLTVWLVVTHGWWTVIVGICVAGWLLFIAWDSRRFEDEKAAFRSYQRQDLHGFAERRTRRHQERG